MKESCMKQDNIILTKSFAFAIRVVKLYKYLCDEKKEYVLSKQLLRNGTSIGAQKLLDCTIEYGKISKAYNPYGNDYYHVIKGDICKMNVMELLKKIVNNGNLIVKTTKLLDKIIFNIFDQFLAPQYYLVVKK